MTPLEAEKIIEEFQKSIKDLRPNGIVLPIKNLPYTQARIKYACFVYGEYLIKDGFYAEGKSPEEISKLFEKKYQELMETYGLIDSLFSEDHERINMEYKKYLVGLENGEVTDFRMPNPFGECAQVGEYCNYIGESWFLVHRTNILRDNPLGAFIYDAVRNKATKEKNIKTLIEIANSGLTRSVDYPGKAD